MRNHGRTGMILVLGLVLLTAPLSKAGKCQPGAAEKAVLAPTPPMGFNTWNKFGCDVGERLIREIADAIVSTGMREAGYKYVVIDDCWQVARAEDGRIVADPERFPSGMKPLSDGSVAVCFLNLSAKELELYVRWSQIGLPPGPAEVRDLWAHRDLGIHADWGRHFNERFKTMVPPHGVVMVRIRKAR